MPGLGGVWRADVVASDAGWRWQIALEAQLAAITADDIRGGVPLTNSGFRLHTHQPPWFLTAHPAQAVAVPPVRLPGWGH